MGHGPNEAMSRPRRQLRVRIQRDHVSNMRECQQVTGFDRETVKGAQQQTVEVHHLAPLALPPHPASFRGVVDAMTVEVEKTAVLVPEILLVELVNQSGTNSHQLIMLIKTLGSIRRIR